ncbi:MAG: hypothetical protein ABIP51_03950, partial [Bacteroidia bacterium]
MKTSNFYLGLASVLIAGSITFTSCHKKEKTKDQEPDTEQSTATDNNMAESNANDIDAIGSQVCESGAMSTFKTDGSMTIEFAPTATITIVGKVATVDFGVIGVVGSDGRTRTGKLIFDYSVSSPTTAIYYRNPGFKVNITSLNYVVDGNQVNIISKTITNTTTSNLPSGSNPGTNLTWAITANISIVKANSGGTISWSCNRTKELTNSSDYLCYNGQAYPIVWTLAKVKLNGTATGTNTKGESFVAKATDLVRDFTCKPDGKRRPFISGKIEYTPGNRPLRLIDFGNGACDLSA